MLPFSSLSQKLFLGYLVATAALIALLLWLSQSDLPWLTRLILAIVMISLVFFVLHLLFMRYFLRPIQQLIKTAAAHAEDPSADIRAHKTSGDELGDLVDTFNDMLDQIQSREEMIVTERDRTAHALQASDNHARITDAANEELEQEVALRKRVENQLTEVQQFLTAIIDFMPSALITIDERLIIGQWNKEATRISGTDPAAAIGQLLPTAFPLLADRLDWIKDVWRDEETQTLHNLKQHDGKQIRHYDIVIYSLKNSRRPSAVIRIDDISEDIQLEEAIIQTEKMMSLGGMAAGLAHEINNPISAILQNVQNIERRIDPELDANRRQAQASKLSLPALADYLEERKIMSFLNHISESGLRASQLVENMLQFSRVSSTSLQPCLIIDVLEKAVSIAATDNQLSDLRESFSLNFEQFYEAPETQVLGVFTELEQVILNLIKNATQAINERRLKRRDINEGLISLQQEIRYGRCLVTVSDNGIGMTAATQKQIFEPFFTTKAVGSGTGLGLSVSYFIINSHHGGQLEVSSEYGSGSVFEISLPLYFEDA